MRVQLPPYRAFLDEEAVQDIQRIHGLSRAEIAELMLTNLLNRFRDAQFSRRVGYYDGRIRTIR